MPTNESVALGAARKTVLALKTELSNAYALIAERDQIIQDLRARSNLYIIILDRDEIKFEEYDLSNTEHPSFIYKFNPESDCKYVITAFYASEKSSDSATSKLHVEINYETGEIIIPYAYLNDDIEIAIEESRYRTITINDQGTSSSNEVIYGSDFVYKINPFISNYWYKIENGSDISFVNGEELNPNVNFENIINNMEVVITGKEAATGSIETHINGQVSLINVRANPFEDKYIYQIPQYDPENFNYTVSGGEFNKDNGEITISTNSIFSIRIDILVALKAAIYNNGELSYVEYNYGEDLVFSAPAGSTVDAFDVSGVKLSVSIEDETCTIAGLKTNAYVVIIDGEEGGKDSFGVLVIDQSQKAQVSRINAGETFEYTIYDYKIDRKYEYEAYMGGESITINPDEEGKIVIDDVNSIIVIIIRRAVAFFVNGIEHIHLSDSPIVHPIADFDPNEQRIKFSLNVDGVEVSSAEYGRVGRSFCAIPVHVFANADKINLDYIIEKINFYKMLLNGEDVTRAEFDTMAEYGKDVDFEKNVYNIKATIGNAILVNGEQFYILRDLERNKAFLQVPAETATAFKNGDVDVTLEETPKIIINTYLPGSEIPEVSYIDPVPQTYTYTLGEKKEGYHYYLSSSNEYTYEYPYLNVVVNGDEDHIDIIVEEVQYFTVRVINGEVIIAEKEVDIHETFEYQINIDPRYKYVVEPGAIDAEGNIRLENVIKNTTIVITKIPLYKYQIAIDDVYVFESEYLEAGTEVTYIVEKDKENHYTYKLTSYDETKVKDVEFNDPELKFVINEDVVFHFTSTQYFIMSIVIDNNDIEEVHAPVDEETFSYTIAEPAEMVIYKNKVTIGNEVYEGATYYKDTYTITIPQADITADGVISFVSYPAILFKVILNDDEEPYHTELIEKNTTIEWRYNGYVGGSKKYIVTVTVDPVILPNGYTFEDGTLIIDGRFVFANTTVNIKEHDMYQLFINGEVSDPAIYIANGEAYTYDIPDYDPNKYYDLIVSRRINESEWETLVQGEAHEGDYDFIISTRDNDVSAAIEIFGESITNDIDVIITTTTKCDVYFTLHDEIQTEGFQKYIRGDQAYVLDVASFIENFDSEKFTFTKVSVTSGKRSLSTEEFNFVGETGKLVIPVETTSTLVSTVSIVINYETSAMNVTVLFNGIQEVIPTVHYNEEFKYYIDKYDDSEYKAWSIKYFINGKDNGNLPVVGGWISIKHVITDCVISIERKTVKVNYAFYSRGITPVAGSVDAPYNSSYTFVFPESVLTEPFADYMYKIVANAKIVDYGKTDNVDRFTFNPATLQQDIQITFFIAYQSGDKEDPNCNIIIHDRDVIIGESYRVSESKTYTYTIPQFDSNTLNFNVWRLSDNMPLQISPEGDVVSIELTQAGGFFIAITDKVSSTIPLFVSDCGVNGIARVPSPVETTGYTYEIGQINGSSAFTTEDNYEVKVMGDGNELAENVYWNKGSDGIEFNGKITIKQTTLTTYPSVFLIVKKVQTVTVKYQGSTAAQVPNAYLDSDYDLNVQSALLMGYSTDMIIEATVKIGDNIFDTDNQSPKTIQLSRDSKNVHHLYIKKDIITGPIVIDFSRAFNVEATLYQNEQKPYIYNPYREGDFKYTIDPYYVIGGSIIQVITQTAVYIGGRDSLIRPNNAGVITIGWSSVVGDIKIVATAEFEIKVIQTGEEAVTHTGVTVNRPYTINIANYDATNTYAVQIFNRNEELKENIHYSIDHDTISIFDKAITGNLLVYIMVTKLQTLSITEPTEEMKNFTTYIVGFESGNIKITKGQLFKDQYIYYIGGADGSSYTSTSDFKVTVTAGSTILNPGIASGGFYDIISYGGSSFAIKFRQLEPSEWSIRSELDIIRIEVSFTCKYGQSTVTFDNQNDLVINTNLPLSSYNVTVKYANGGVLDPSAITINGSSIIINKAYLTYSITVETVKKEFVVNASQIQLPGAYLIADEGDAEGQGKIDNVGSLSYNASSNKPTVNKGEYDIEGVLSMNSITKWRYTAGGDFAYWVGIEIPNTVAQGVSTVAFYWDGEVIEDKDIADARTLATATGDVYLKPYYDNLANRNLNVVYKFAADEDKEAVTVNYITKIIGSTVPTANLSFFMVDGTSRTECPLNNNIIIQNRGANVEIMDYADNYMHKYADELEIYMNGIRTDAVKATLDSLTGKIHVDAVSNLTGDVQIIGNVTYTKYTVTFNSQGGSVVAAQVVAWNELATEPENPTKENMTFAGWWTEADEGKKWEFGTMKITENITLYAHWTTYKFMLNVEGVGVQVNNNYTPQGVNDDKSTFTFTFALVN